MPTRRRPGTRRIPPTCRPSTKSTDIRAEGGRAVLIKRTERQTRRSSLAATVGSQSGVGLDRRSFLAPFRSGRRRFGDNWSGTARQCAESGSGRSQRGRGHHPEKYLHALLGWLHGTRRSVERRVGRSGAGLGQPDQPGLALRQGRGNPRAGAWRSPFALPDETGGRSMDPDLVGYSDQRDRRQNERDPEKVRCGIGLLAGIGQVYERGRLSQS